VCRGWGCSVRGWLVASLWVVLSIGRLSNGQEGYYLAQVAAGAEDYYLHAGEVPGRWVGAGAAGLGLVGEVAGGDLRVVLAGRSPVGALRVTNASVPGFDLTVSAPKSVSVLWALDPDRADAVLAGHDAAVDAVVTFLERDAVRVRRGRAGGLVVPSGGMVAGGFRHRMSRVGDPALHTHVVVANMAQGPDGRWTALDSRSLYAQARTAGFVYQAVLRAELVTRLGVVWEPVTNGYAEISGIPTVLRDRFSTRRRQIDELLEARGWVGASAAQTAVLATRSTKPVPVSEPDLRDRWTRHAAGVVWAPVLVPRVAAARVDVAELAQRLVVSDATFDRGAVVREVASLAGQGVTLAELDGIVAGFLSSSAVVAVGERRWTTPAMLALETRALTLAAGRVGHGSPVDATVAGAVIAQRRSLGADQAAMVHRLLTGPDAVMVVIGPAGTGKTFALDAARDGWERAGRRVVGVALAARAAGELSAGSGIAATTIERFWSQVASGRVDLRAGDVLVVDEAGMVGTRTLARLVEFTAARDALLVAVGDPRQLPEIDAGGLFAGLAATLGRVELVDNRRQRDPVERAAVAALRDGAAGVAVDRLAGRGRIVVDTNSDRLRDRVIDDWWHARRRGEQVLVVATHRVTVDDLNDRARARLSAVGELGPVVFDDGTVRFAVGETVVCHRNDRRLGVVNGLRGRVTGGDPTGVQIEVGDRDVWLPAGYANGWLRHGWAVTIHKAQGVTVDRVFIAVDDTVTLESGYTALTRGRFGNHLYVHHGDATRFGFADLDVDHLAGDDRDPLEVLAGRLARSGAKRTALDHLLSR